MVYGALANNPVPLTEAAVLQPDPTNVYARQLASAEETIETWRTNGAGRTVAIVATRCPDRGLVAGSSAHGGVRPPVRRIGP